MDETTTHSEATGVEERLRAALEGGGHRFTAQRAAVYAVLEGATSHPTADEIFTAARASLPDISLATVYKALEAFVSCGLARKLTIGPGPARYDSRMDRHDHFRCLACGAVRDVEEARPDGWFDTLGEAGEFDIVGYRLELVGYCHRCRV